MFSNLVISVGVILICLAYIILALTLVKRAEKERKELKSDNIQLAQLARRQEQFIRMYFEFESKVPRDQFEKAKGEIL